MPLVNVTRELSSQSRKIISKIVLSYVIYVPRAHPPLLMSACSL